MKESLKDDGGAGNLVLSILFGIYWGVAGIAGASVDKEGGLNALIAIIADKAAVLGYEIYFVFMCINIDRVEGFKDNQVIAQNNGLLN